MATGGRLEMLLIAKVDQCIEIIHRLGKDMATAPAIPTVGTAKLDIFLPAKGQAPIAAPPRQNINPGPVEKFHGLNLSLVSS